MIQTAQQWLQNTGPTDYIIASMVIGMLAIALWLKRSKRNKKKAIDEHAVYLGYETIPSTTFIGPGLAKF